MAANVKKAQQVLVVVNDDADTLLITMSIQSINPDVKISVNLHNRENMKHLERIGVTEIVCDEELTGNALINAFYNNQSKGKKNNS